MTATTMTRTKKSCGKCGASAPCRCCQPVCESFTNDSACMPSGFARPRFFAGQLLTEEDLQDLTGYVVMKNRLHNRYLVGAGVVCGLDVRMHPCNSRAVNIGAGYALDCCGNDISVPCLIEGLDIIAMIQDLRAGLRGGYDCGDPCRSAKDNADKPSNAATQLARPQLYDLYVRYCERNADLQTPYEFESCAAPGCQASRVEEGFTFELRCAPVECVTDPQTHQKSYAEAKSTLPPSLGSNLLDCLKTDDNKKLADEALAALYVLETIHKARFQADVLESQEIKPKLTALANTQLKGLAKELDGAGVDESITILHRSVVWAIRSKILKLPIDQDATNVTATLTTKLGNLLSATPSAEDAKTLRDFWQKYENLNPNQLPPALDRAAAVAGELVDLAQVNEKIRSLNGLRDTIARLHADGLVEVDDQQRRFLRDYEFKELAPGAEIADIEQRREAALKLGKIVFVNRQKCFCDSLPPPCLPCDDPAVRLARLEVDVQECRIIHVCNLQRTFALTGTAMRYWLSRLQRWFDVFRNLCCIPYEKRHQVIDLKSALHDDVATKFSSDNFQVAPWRRIPDSQDPLENMAALTEQVALIARVDFRNITDALDPLGSRAEPKKDVRPARDDLTKEIQALRNDNAALSGRLQDTQGQLEDAKSQLRDLAAKLEQSPVRSLTEEWNSKALDIAYVRKRFLRDALRDRLVGADTTALQGQPKGLESLKQVSAMQVKGLSDVPAAQRDVWKLRSVKELLNGEQDLLQDIAENPAIEAFWRKVHELRFLTENWPDNVLATADFLTH